MGLNGILTTSVHSFEEAKAGLNGQQLSGDFDTATDQMDGAKVCDVFFKNIDVLFGTFEEFNY